MNRFSMLPNGVSYAREEDLQVASRSFNGMEAADARAELNRRYRWRWAQEMTATDEADTPFMFWLGKGFP